MRLWPFGNRGLERKYSAAGPNIARVLVGQAVWTPRDYGSLAEEAYKRNALAFRAVKLVASCAAGVPLLLFDGADKEVEAHPLLDLLRRPSSAYAGAAFFEAVYAYLLLSGNSYIEAVGPERGAPKELWPLRPDRMQIIAGRYGFPQGYRYTAHGLPRDWSSNPLNGDGPILHVKDFNPLDDWYGLSRIEAAAYGIDRHNAASIHNKALLDHGARPSGALAFKPVKVGKDEYTRAPQDLVDAAMEKLNTTMVGPANAGKPMVFSGDVDWIAMSLSPKDMDFNEGKNDAARDILTAIGVPAVLLVPGESTYSNRAEANLELYEQTVLPLVTQIVSGLNQWLCPRFGEGLRLGIDFDGVSALEPRRENRRKSALDLFNAGVIDRDEARDMLQYGEASADFVEKPDSGILGQLSSASIMEAAGDEPLFSYLLRTGLLPKGTDIEKFRQGAADYEGQDDDDDELVAALPDTKAERRTLYVSRPLLNGADLIAWARGQGFATTIPASDLHVTLAYSKRALDWSKLKPDTSELLLPSSKRRTVETLGDQGSVVLLFQSEALQSRWRAIMAAGASWDYAKYRPHVSITYDAGEIDLEQIDAYSGELRFGPERFEEIDSGALDRVRSSEKDGAQ
jgi:HK97 family phage portal protein